jgi:glyceraldehyde 3-phosphate dehydrogenase
MPGLRLERSISYPRCVPVVDLTVETERPTSADEVNDIFAGRADRDELEGIFAYSEDPIVSSEIVGSPYSAIFDGASRA